MVKPYENAYAAIGIKKPGIVGGNSTSVQNATIAITATAKAPVQSNRSGATLCASRPPVNEPSIRHAALDANARANHALETPSSRWNTNEEPLMKLNIALKVAATIRASAGVRGKRRNRAYKPRIECVERRSSVSGSAIAVAASSTKPATAIAAYTARHPSGNT